MSKAVCPECGAMQEAGAECVDCFHALLAYENERPAAFGAVHHLTVACYFLQHPAGYTPAALGMWRALVADALDGRATIHELQARSGRRFAGSRRLRDSAAVAPDWWPRVWPMTVQHLLRPGDLPSIDDYIDRARRWAMSTRSTLDLAERDTRRRTAHV